MSKEKRDVIEAKKRMREIAFASNREELVARIINDTYDPELPMRPIAQEIFNTQTADPFEDINYFLPTLPTKEVYVLSANCNVTHAVVAPTSKQTLSWTSLVTKDYYICLDDLLEGAHNVLDLYGVDIIEELNRYEDYATLLLVDAGAVARSNVFAPDSGSTKLTYKKAYEMKKAIRKYGSKFVLITGANVTEDVDLMDYNEDKNRPVKITDIVDTHISVEDYQVTVNTVEKDVMDADLAYLVAVSDSKKNKPGYFVRRKLSGAIVASAPDTTVVDKERAILASGNMKSVDGVEKFSKGIAGVEQIGIVLTNSYTCAKFDLNG